MFVQVAPGNARSRNPENPIENKAVVPWTTPAARASLDHEWLKASPFLVAHQTPDQDSLPKNHLESDIAPLGNPLCQQVLDCRWQFELSVFAFRERIGGFKLLAGTFQRTPID